jgi:hypothetical protein
MVRYPEPRSVRRAARRAAAKAAAEERLRAREARKEEERREQQRRTDPPLQGEALDRRLRELGIGQDRRRAPGDRRSGTDRRRR